MERRGGGRVKVQNIINRPKVELSYDIKKKIVDLLVFY